MKKVFVIGVGAGNPEYVTVQAINALNEADVFFVFDKGREKAALLRLRKEICERYIRDRSYKTIAVKDPQRDQNARSYVAGVKAWHEQRVAVLEQLIDQELAQGQCGAFLVWGDPSLYDSTLRIIEQIRTRGVVVFDYEVIPGISSIQALAARHKIALNRIGGDVQITTGRALAAAPPDRLDDVVVLLDGECAFRNIEDEDVEIFWGAYLGTDDEILISGKLKEAAPKIEQIRAEVRERHGWIMDAYLLRRTKPQ